MSQPIYSTDTEDYDISQQYTAIVHDGFITIAQERGMQFQISDKHGTVTCDESKPAESRPTTGPKSYNIGQHPSRGQRPDLTTHTPQRRIENPPMILPETGNDNSVPGPTSQVDRHMDYLDTIHNQTSGSSNLGGDTGEYFNSSGNITKKSISDSIGNIRSIETATRLGKDPINTSDLLKYSDEMFRDFHGNADNLILPLPEWAASPLDSLGRYHGPPKSTVFTGKLSHYDSGQKKFIINAPHLMYYASKYKPKLPQTEGSIQKLEDNWYLETKKHKPDSKAISLVKDKRGCAPGVFNRALIHAVTYITTIDTNINSDKEEITETELDRQQIDIDTLVYVADQMLQPREGYVQQVSKTLRRQRN
ncbi:uncharacterized protein I206_105066 [Kwoniella pini CBS 10737]|uniref:Uncharacterized protein n=1 Tax=Kwoniella pini CBS 10737 TaxID=1296096 RepID=A0A1B9I8P8_9TREE|nr:uncharacterized protein I206_02606 [Kwoniella pini CBS 10737]OCF51890.1 hypothetical protein I206_02606 [Kwoniella pini CBS 10737]